MPHLAYLYSVLPPRATVLEAGCGLGKYVYSFAAAGHYCIGLDFSPKLIELAKSRGRSLSTLNDLVEWRVGDILDLPLPDASLDCYASFGVLEHFDGGQQERILSEAFRTLKPGGVIYQHVPNFWSFWTVRRELRYWYRQIRPPKLVWQRNISKARLRRLGAKAGFSTELLRTFDAAGALESAAPPAFVNSLMPGSLRRLASRGTEALGKRLDKFNLGGLSLVWVGRKPK